MENQHAAVKLPVDVRKSARTAALTTLISGTVVLASLCYSAFQIHSLDAKLTERVDRLNQLRKEIEPRQQRVKELELQEKALSAKVQGLNDVIALIPSDQFRKATDSAKATAKLPVRVYVHIASEKQRPAAENAATKLRNAGYIVPGIEYVGAKAPKPTQVRFFHRTDEQEPDLPGIIRTLHDAGIDAHSQFTLLPGTVRPHQFELWFGAGN